MSDQLRFDGQVAVITGAGGGLGREYALLLASRGAAVVVNDLGSARDGQGKNSKAADAVVREIQVKGGRAVANYDSVEEGHLIVAAAVKEFGRIDILINNAGFLRDKSFAKMEESDWDAIHRVHLRGVFVTTRAAWPLFRQQHYGRVLLTSSAAGLFGNFGQANYSAAKLGLVGLGKTLAQEGDKYDISTNILVPAAASRLTADVFPDHLLQLLGPAQVAPVAVLLVHRSCPVSGAVVEAAGGAAALYRWQRSRGMAAAADTLTPELVRDRWSELADFDGAPPEPVDSAAAQMSLIAEQLEEAAAELPAEDAGTAGDGVAAAVRARLPSARLVYGPQQAILYALGIGVSLTDVDGLRYLYELHPDYAVHPMFSCLAVNAVDSERLANLPGFPIDLSQLLHGEHYIEMKKLLPPSGKLKVSFNIPDIIDKSDKGAVVLLEVTVRDDDDEEVAVQQASLFIRGAGGFGGSSKSQRVIPCCPVPERRPDAILTYTTNTDQAALYRLTGDRNPLHIDPQFAELGGQPRPILHGMCALSASVRLILDKYTPGQPQRCQRVKARFSRPVLPGDTLLVETWFDAGVGRVHFQTRIQRTNQLAVSGGYVDVRPAETAPSAVEESPSLASDVMFTSLQQRLTSQPALARATPAVLQFHVTRAGALTPAASWVVDLKSSPAGVRRGDVEGPDATVTADDDTFVQLFSGKLKPMAAFSQGKVKATGKIMLLQNIGKLFSTEARL